MCLEGGLEGGESRPQNSIIFFESEETRMLELKDWREQEFQNFLAKDPTVHLELHPGCSNLKFPMFHSSLSLGPSLQCHLPEQPSMTKSLNSEPLLLGLFPREFSFSPYPCLMYFW